MSSNKSIDSELEFTKTFKDLSSAYEEISVMKMRKIRQSVISTRSYLEKLSEVFADVKKAYNKKEKLKLKAVKKREAVNPNIKKKINSDKINKQVSVLLSANTSLYGDLIERVFKYFAKDISKSGNDILIIGRVGRRLYEQSGMTKKYLYFELPDLDITLEDLKPVIFSLVRYQSVLVYYGKFENLVNQTPIVANVSGDQPMTNPFPTKKEIPVEYLFEPSLDRILTIFQNLISTSLFRQTVQESQLARLGSRIMSMEKAQQNVDIQIKKLKFLAKKTDRQEDGKKQLERLTGIGLWTK